MDLNAEKAQALGTRYDIPVLPTLAALRAAGAEVIHVLTPPVTHVPVALEAIALGCHVFVEKPMATDVDDCHRLERAASEKGVRVGVCHSLLFDPQVKLALEAARRGELGRIVSVDILRSSIYPPYEGGPLPPHYRDPGYPFRDLGVHCLYLLEAFLGPIQDVEARWASRGGDANLAFDEWRAMVKCRDGLGQFQLSWNVHPIQSQIIIQGEKGVRRADLFLMFQASRKETPLPKPIGRVINAITDSVQPLADVSKNVVAFATKRVRPYHGLQDLIAAFYASLDGGQEVPVGIEDAVRVVRWTEHVARAADADFERRVKKARHHDHVDVLVTGASGGLGGAVVRRLLARGLRVRAFVRRLPDEPPEGLDVMRGDLGDPGAVERAVAGARRVIHVGAAMKGGKIEHRTATVIGTRNVLAACKQHGIERVVHISSLSVIDWAGGDGVVDEATPLEPHPERRGAYTQAKLEAEAIVSEAITRGDVRGIILRPGQIFGGKIPLFTAAIARRAAGRWLILGDGELPLPLVYLDDVVDAIETAMDVPLDDGHNGAIVQLVDPESLTQMDVMRMVHGDGVKVTRVPRAFTFSAGGLSEIVLGALGRSSPVSRYRLASALAKRRFASERAGSLLGWRPRVGVREGIRQGMRKGMWEGI
jgi:predicted dehydrogenase/nucleoside-diphosphate-sugar epimerase